MLNELDGIRDRYGIENRVIDNIKRSLNFNKKIEPKLTALQKEALSKDNEWFHYSDKDSNNVIIQGATSAGKTLLAEIIMLEYVYQTKKAIYLVPLRALASEKEKQFKKDVEGNNFGIKIYASSSDFQDHDNDLIEGNYSVAVIVYEKFFALLAEKNNKMLADGDIIIIDEFQHLSVEDRGPKLEYALTKIMKKHSNIRLMGITTTDCTIEKIKKWMGKDTRVIYNQSRPIGMRENIISIEDGHYIQRVILGENDSMDINYMPDNKNEDDLKISKEQRGNLKAHNNSKTNQKKELFLEILLDKIYKDNYNSKVIVFVNSRTSCRKVAKNIAKYKIIKNRLNKGSQSYREIEQIDDVELRRLFQDELFPYGVAYHNAQLSMRVRDTIEREFKRNDGCIKILVATETITIGMNMPADYMIIYDREVNRGGQVKRDINLQEYRNYIGRAGRLGMTEQKGESFLFAEDRGAVRRYWNKYVNENKEEIESAIPLIKEQSNRDLEFISAPYYLNLLKGNDGNLFFIEEDLNSWYESTLNKYSSTDTNLNFDKIIKYLSIAKLVEENSDVIDDFELDFDDDKKKYSLTIFGDSIAPYALRLETCKLIYDYFICDGKKENGLPYNYDIPENKEDYNKAKMYELDILYYIASTKEVEKLLTPKMSDKDSNLLYTNYLQERKAIEQYLKGQGEDSFWHNSKLLQIINDDYSDKDEKDIFNRAYRAILMFLWSQGLTRQEIKNKLELPNLIIYESDLIRAGETISYILEAVANCMKASRKRDRELEQGVARIKSFFMKLSSRIKYGLCNQDALRIAKRQIPGLERGQLIRLEKAAKLEDDDSIYMFIKYNVEKSLNIITNEQREELLKSLKDRYEDRTNFEQLLIKLEEDGIINHNSEWYQSFNQLSHTISNDNLEQNDWKKYVDDVIGEVIESTRKEQHDNRIYQCTFGEEIIRFIFIYDSSNIDEESIKYYVNSDSKNIIITHKFVELPVSLLQYAVYTDINYLCHILLQVLRYTGDINSDKNNKYILAFFLFSYNAYVGGKIKHKGDRRIFEDIEKSLSRLRSRNTEKKSEKSEIKNKLSNYEIGNMIGSSNNHVYILKPKDNSEILKDKKALKILDISVHEDDELQNKVDNFYEKISELDHESMYEANVIKEKLEDCDREYIKKIIDDIKEHNPDIIAQQGKRAYCEAIIYGIEAHHNCDEVNIVRKIKAYNVVKVDKVFVFNGKYEPNTFKRAKNSPVSSWTVAIVMDYMERNADEEERWNPVDVLKLGKDMCDVLIKCERSNIIHRDIKPANILISEGGDYFLGDFGSAIDLSGDNNKKYIRDGGTRGYIAPECLGNNNSFDYRSDIYSLGKTLWYLLKGEKHKDSISEHEINDDELSRAIHQACYDDIDKRYKNAQDFLSALDDIDENNLGGLLNINN